MVLDCFRFEASDGSGPFYNLDGTSKGGGRSFPPDDIRCGCDSLENLYKWFSRQGFNVDRNIYHVVVYKVDIPNSSYNKENGHIEFDCKKEVLDRYDY